MLVPFGARFADMDDEELRDLLDETENSKLRERINKELARRSKERAESGGPLRMFLWVIGIFGFLGLLIAFVAMR